MQLTGAFHGAAAQWPVPKRLPTSLNQLKERTAVLIQGCEPVPYAKDCNLEKDCFSSILFRMLLPSSPIKNNTLTDDTLNFPDTFSIQSCTAFSHELSFCL